MRKPTFIFAGRLERFFAYLLDTIILFAPKFLLIGLFGNSGLVPILAFLCDAAYATMFVGSHWQATPGQRILNIYIVRESGHRLGNSAALERYLAYVLPSLPLYTSLLPDDVGRSIAGMLIMAWFGPILFTPERTGVHDMLCKTRVIVGRPDGR